MEGSLMITVCSAVDALRLYCGAQGRRDRVVFPLKYFGRLVNPIPTRGQIMPTTLLLAPPGFKNLTTAL